MTQGLATPPLATAPDDKIRCHWPGQDPLYVAYHDEEWGVPEYDDRALFEKLILDGFQAGLSWITILRKRDAFRSAFDGFDPAVIARYDAKKTAALMLDQGIVRNKAKIEGTVASAQAYLALQEQEGFANYLWNFFDGQPLQNRFRDKSKIPAETPLSLKISKDLKQRGFKFCGPTIVYAFCQAVGMVNDHVVTCWRHDKCAALAKNHSSSPGKLSEEKSSEEKSPRAKSLGKKT
jgi:DNA-3-methyladenine glycosylase I